MKLRAKYQYDKKNSCIEILEIPYTTNIEAINKTDCRFAEFGKVEAANRACHAYGDAEIRVCDIDKIFALVKAGKLKDITDVRDETDLNGLKIAIDIKKSANSAI